MKILMQIRNNVFSCPGGDTVQMQKTKQELEALGYDVDLSLELRPNLESYDLVHLFNLTRVQETYIQVQNAVEPSSRTNPSCFQRSIGLMQNSKRRPTWEFANFWARH